MSASPRTPLSGVDISCPDCDGRVRSGAIDHAESCPAARALEEISRIDREWFAAHPFASSYRRELMAGDLGVGTLEDVLLGTVDGRPATVVVRQVAEGVRVRSIPGGLVLNPLSLWGELAAQSLAGISLPRPRWWER